VADEFPLAHLGSAEKVQHRYGCTCLLAQDVFVERHPTNVALHVHAFVGGDELNGRRIVEKCEIRTGDFRPTVQGDPARMRADNTVRVFPKIRHGIHVAHFEGFVVRIVCGEDGIKSFDAIDGSLLSVKTVTSTDGTSLAWYDFGGKGPDLLLAHATGFCGEIWGPVVEHLEHHFRCVAFDLRGHGNSASPEGGREAWNWTRYADDAKAVIDAAQLTNPYGVGHSCGGATELLTEQRFPNTFRQLYLFEPVIFTDIPPLGPDPERELAVRTRRRQAQFASRQEALEKFSSRGPFAALDAAVLETYVDKAFEHHSDGTISLKLAPDDEAEVYVMASAHDGYVRLPEVRTRTTVAHGATSTSFTETHMRAVADRLPDGSFAQWNDVGHFGPLEHPREFAEAVVATFLGSNA
jgi:pimeloyl-ACP methyl ester carboxylesterase